MTLSNDANQRERNMRVIAAIAAAALLSSSPLCAAESLPPPGFHHLHLNSVDPDAAISYYVKEFPSTSKTTWSGLPALASPNNVLVLFSNVTAPPAADP